MQCCSQGQNQKAKDEAKATTLKAEAMAWTLEAKTKTKAWTLQLIDWLLYGTSAQKGY